MVAHYLSTTRGPEAVKAFIDHGYLPVDIFMILSGFVLALTYQAGFREAIAPVAVGRFLIVRLARIYPLHAMTSLVCAIQILAGLDVWGNAGTTVGVVAANLLLVQAWTDTGHTLNAPAWSISTEWAANLLFPLFVAVLLRGSDRRAAGIAGAALAILTACALAFGSLGEAAAWRGAINWYAGPMAIMRCTTEFILGMYCWRIGNRPWAVWLGTTPALLSVAIAMVGLTVYTWWDIPLVILSCMLVVGLASERSPVAVAFGTRLPRWLGTISFSLYLWQIPVLPLRPYFIAVCGGTSDPWLFGNLATMAVVLAVSAASFQWLERPAQRALRAVRFGNVL